LNQNVLKNQETSSADKAHKKQNKQSKKVFTILQISPRFILYLPFKSTMSAYASSSSFFFPSFSSLYSSTKDTKVVASSCDEISTSSSSSLTVSSSTLSSSPRANDDDLNEKQQCNESDGNHETTNSWYNSSQDMFISIKSASIDPIRYIQSLTTRRPSGTSNDLASPPRSIGVNSVRRDSAISTLS